MPGSPIDLGPMLIGLVVLCALAGLTLGGWFTIAGRQKAQIVVENALTTTDELGDAENRLRILLRAPQSALPPGGDEFLPHAQTSILEISQARSANRLEDVAGLLTPAYYETLLAEQRADPQPAATLDLQVLGARVDAVQRNQPRDGNPSSLYDLVRVDFGATSRLTTTGVDGNPVTLTTVLASQWRFIRAAGLPDEPAALEAARVCPNCGASLGDAPSGTCPYCHQVTVGNAHGWLVDKIDIQPMG